MSTGLRDMFDLSGRVAVVTGASRGIGLAIARGLAECGASLVLCSRSADTISAVAEQLQADGFEATGVGAHLGRAEDIARLASAVEDQFGRADILVNNAATNPVFAPLLECDAAVFDKIVAVNIKGPWELSRRLHRLLAGGDGAAIVNVASVAGIRPEAMLGLYSMSKAALINLTKTMAAEWASDRIRVNALCPGLIKTDFSAALWQDKQTLNRFLAGVPLGRVATPEEVVALAVYLASPASSYCTGAVFTVDGGYTA